MMFSSKHNMVEGFFVCLQRCVIRNKKSHVYLTIFFSFFQQNNLLCSKTQLSKNQLMSKTQVKQKNEDIELLNLKRGEKSKSFEILQKILTKGLEFSILHSLNPIYYINHINIFWRFLMSGLKLNFKAMNIFL